MTDPAPGPSPSSAPPAAARPLPVSGYPEWDEAGYSRLPTRFEVLGILFSRFLGKAAVVLALGAIGLVVLVGVPAWSVARSTAYHTACNFVSGRGEVEAEIGPVVACERVPTRYWVAKDEARFTFVVYGEGSAGAADVRLRGTGDVWVVTSASFVAGRRGVSRIRVLLDGSRKK